MGYKVDLIARKVHQEGPIALIESFDFGFIQMCYDGSRVLDTAASRMDRYLQRYTMSHDRHIEQSLARFYRFNARNPGLLSLNMPFPFDPVNPGVVEATNDLDFIL